MIAEHDTVSLSAFILAFVALGGFFLRMFSVLLKYSESLGKVSTLPHPSLEPIVPYVKQYILPALTSAFGNLSSFSYKLEHILLVAILAAMLLVARNQAIGNELTKQLVKNTKPSGSDNKKKD
jgi:ABC-type dipeptide/oligopeptide/nickel transport system permease component